MVIVLFDNIRAYLTGCNKCESATYTYKFSCFCCRNRDEIVERIINAANPIVDTVLELLKKYVVNHSLDPVAVPDMTQKFNVVSCKK
jgi:hypothetical protein